MTLKEPRVGLLLGVRPPETLVALCRQLAAWVPIGDGRDGGTYDLLIWRPGDPAGPGAVPYLLFADDRSIVDAHGKKARLVLATRLDVITYARKAGYPARGVPRHSDPATEAVPVAPFVRSRIRASRGLSEVVVAERDDGWLWEGTSVAGADDLVDTMLGLASVVVTAIPVDAIRALAWGAPLVTSPQTARLLGARNRIECVVAPDGESRRRLAVEVAQDIRLAARIGWRGRLLYERRHSLRKCSEDVLAAIGMQGKWGPSSLTSLLGELGTRPSAYLVRRVADCVDPIVRPFSDWTGEPA
jgi:hypothetical protein